MNLAPMVIKENQSMSTDHDGCRLDDVAILLVGHGTRKDSGQDQFRDLYQKFALAVSPMVCELAFLELASPSISQAVQRLAANGRIRRLLVVPALLFTAGHALQDIPRAVRDSLRDLPIQLLGQTQPLECSAEVLQLSAIRFQQAACPTGCLKSCGGEVCQKTTWVLVGRGSSSQTAADRMREFCRLRQQWTPVKQAITAFIYGQSPSVTDAFQLASQSDTEIVVVQPHLLFSGLLLDELSQKVAQFGQQNPHQRWLMTHPLGSDQRLAELLAQTVRNELQKQTS